MKLTELVAERQREIYRNVSLKTGLPPFSIEKDWWITQALKALFSLPYAEHLSFKGGTSLSKCWMLIERFSEDIDIALDREFLGFARELTKTQISDKLRRAACSFVREKMQYELRNALLSQGCSETLFSVKVNVTPVTTTDPEVIFVEYKSVFPEQMNGYLPPIVKIEISGRSMAEPVKVMDIRSMVDETFAGSAFYEGAFPAKVVLPERTFLEKMCLVHEELTRENLRIDRMSRHIYDLVKMMDKGIHAKAIQDADLYRQVVEHRRKFIGLKGFDYDSLYPERLSIIPGDAVSDLWESDYKKMCEHMIWGDAPSYSQLIEKIRSLNEQVHSLSNLCYKQVNND